MPFQSHFYPHRNTHMFAANDKLQMGQCPSSYWTLSQHHTLLLYLAFSVVTHTYFSSSCTSHSFSVGVHRFNIFPLNFGIVAYPRDYSSELLSASIQFLEDPIWTLSFFWIWSPWLLMDEMIQVCEVCPHRGTSKA